MNIVSKIATKAIAKTVDACSAGMCCLFVVGMFCALYVMGPETDTDYQTVIQA